jgi:hypothetical protein
MVLMVSGSLSESPPGLVATNVVSEVCDTSNPLHPSGKVISTPASAFMYVPLTTSGIPCAYADTAATGSNSRNAATKASFVYLCIWFPIPCVYKKMKVLAMWIVCRIAKFIIIVSKNCKSQEK